MCIVKSSAKALVPLDSAPVIFRNLVQALVLRAAGTFLPRAPHPEEKNIVAKTSGIRVSLPDPVASVKWE